MPAPKNNQYAAKPDDQKPDGTLHLTCFLADKGEWVRASREKGMKLAPWVVEQLNAAVSKAP